MNRKWHLLEVPPHKHLNTQDSSWDSSCTHLYLYILTELDATIFHIWVRIWLLSTFLPLVKYKLSWMPKNLCQFHFIHHTYKIWIMDTEGFWTALEIRNLQHKHQSFIVREASMSLHSFSLAYAHDILRNGYVSIYGWTVQKDYHDTTTLSDKCLWCSFLLFHLSPDWGLSLWLWCKFM